MTGYTIRKNMQTSLVTFMVVTTLSRHIHQHYRIRAESLVHLVLPCTIFICASLCKEDQLLKKKKRPSSPPPGPPPPPPGPSLPPPHPPPPFPPRSNFCLYEQALFWKGCFDRGSNQEVAEFVHPVKMVEKYRGAFKHLK